jgi:hypothetical protein
LAEKSDDPLAEAATTAEIAVSQQAASNPQPTFSVNPSDISLSRIALGEAPSSTCKAATQNQAMSVTIGFVLERQPCLSE